MPAILDTYERLVLRRPALTIAAIAAATLAFGWFAQDFALDASADALVLERDEDLSYYRFVRARYGSDSFLLVTYAPDGEMFASPTLADLAELHDELAGLAEVASVASILNVPLLMSPPLELDDFASGVRYLRDPETDRDLAREELTSSPLYENLLISSDASTTALRVDLQQELEHRELRARRDALREKNFIEGLDEAETAELEQVTAAFEEASQNEIERQRQAIASVRQVLDRHRDGAALYLGGLPMIVADSIDFIRRDLVVFGAGVMIFLVVILALAFKKRRWIVLPLLTCATTVVVMLGLLGLLGWRVTVVSSNFPALLFILCLALTLHIIVRYREHHESLPDASQRELVLKTVQAIVVPCLYTALTTIVAFGSLLVSGVRPVINFGWMMSIGIVVAFVLAFTLFPAILLLLKPGAAPSRTDLTDTVTRFFSDLVHEHQRRVLVFFLFIVALGLAGTTRLSVENRFIDYYKESTEIYQGMLRIDRALGGTTPLDVIVDAPPEQFIESAAGDGEEEFEDIYADESDGAGGITSQSYWLNSWRLGDVDAMHAYLERLSDTGKVISLATFARLLQGIDPDVVSDNFMLSIVYEKLPDDVRSQLISPYLSGDGDQLRFSVRVFESDPELHRDELLQRIRTDFERQFGIGTDSLRLSGMLVLYNNMLHSLFRSQILTLGAVFIAIAIMFLILFRSLRIALVATLPTMSSAAIVLGLMGWVGIPLDLMTITIAAITVGIGVDDTIHYVHRFRHEFGIDRDYWAAVERSHRSIGRAIYYTSVTIMLGFSILVFSNFVPTIYFGLLTGLAMLVALVANMTLLPLLMVRLRAFGRARQSA